MNELTVNQRLAIVALWDGYNDNAIADLLDSVGSAHSDAVVDYLVAMCDLYGFSPAGRKKLRQDILAGIDLTIEN